MGAILAKFRKTNTTAEVLEKLEEKIQQIEKYSLNTQEQKKRFVGGFLAFSIGLFVIAFIVVYFLYLPTTWKGRITYSIPMLLFPLVIILLRRLFTWYFQRKLNKNSDKLTELRAEKKKILEQVMDKETYKVAVNLLARFGEKNSGSKFSLAMTPRITNPSTTPLSNQSLRVRGPAGDAGGTAAAANQLRLFSSSMSNRTPALQGTPRQATSMTQLGGMAAPRQLALSPQSHAGQELRRRTPFPIVNQHDKGVFERIVDVLIGDGPQDRFAMICKECHAHNGMALKEEFDYTTFRCAFCNAMNPARKERPVAPRLPVQQHAIAAARNSSDSSSSDETDDEKVYEKQVPPQRLTELTNASINADSISDSMADEEQQHDNAAIMTTAVPDIEIDDIEMIDSSTLNDAEQTVKTDESPAASHTPKLNDEFKKEM